MQQTQTRSEVHQVINKAQALNDSMEYFTSKYY
ncbi:hypothetical protein ACO2E2_06690 [Staphylococcus epidermidis]